ncbi:MAG: dihydrolipoyl dehydrogenase [Anaerostipes sp.]|nr:dihydrolipoyl dehydrogenase [Anaerostipes sp.]
MDTADLIVIGGGPAGYLAAQRAAEGGMQAVLFEEKNLGGVCLNEGCVPTKTLLNCAKIYHHAKCGQAFGVSAEHVELHIPQVIARKNKVVKTLVSGVAMTMKKNKVKVISQKAVIEKEVEDGFLVKSEEQEYKAKNILIASGSEAVIPNIPGTKESLEQGLAVTSREILDEETLPEKLTIIGAGVIGLEMATYFNTVGVEVTVVEMLDKVAGSMDVKLSKLLEKELKKKGIQFMLDTKVVELKGSSLVCEKNGEIINVEGDKILFCIGRRPVTQGLGLENMGVKVEKGIVTDEHLCTSVKGVYAAGDVNGKIMLAHTGYRESEVAVHHMLGIEDKMDYNVIPSVVYTFPEMASVGETLESAKEKGLEVKVAELPMMYSGRFVAENDKESGTCKLLLDTKTNCLAGAHLLGTYASELIWGLAALIGQKVTVDEIKKIVFPHPSVSEIVKETIFKL